MRKINYIIVHCTATPEGRPVAVKEIEGWHKARGFRTIGYHYVVGLNGEVMKGRNESEVGAHCLGRNSDSVGVCYVGGLERDCKTPKDTRTPLQKTALTGLLKKLKSKYPDAQIKGHRDFASKACPCFDAGLEYAGI